MLIVQLKRFQFDQYSRRKLNNHIDFPFEGLDLFDYLATSRKRGLSTVSLPDTGAEGPNAAHGMCCIVILPRKIYDWLLYGLLGLIFNT